MLNEEGRIQLGFKVSGTFSQPQISMTSPTPDSLANAVKNTLQENLRSRGKELIEGTVKRLLEKIKEVKTSSFTQY
jgi:hypothetical protein